MTQIIEVAISDDHAELVAAAMSDVKANEELDDKTREMAGMLSSVFQGASENPDAFPPRPAVASSIKKRLTKMKGTSQPQGRKNKRKARQEQRQGWNKQRRRLRAANAKAYNEARDIMEAERIEADEAHAERVARLQLEPKFNVVGMSGEVLLQDVPESMLIRQLAEAVDETPKVVLP